MTAISIIIPVFNTEEYLAECFKSILNQNFTDFEVIVVDDGSVDSSYQICKKYESYDKRIKVFSIKNSGPAAARNYGINMSLGEYITFVDSDDVLTKSFLSRMYYLVTKYNADVCTATFDRLTTSIVPEELMDIKEYCEEVIYTDNLQAMERFIALNNNKFRSPVAKLIKADIVRKHLFPIDRKWSEDTAVVYLWYYEAKTIVDIDDMLYIYRANPESIAHSRNYEITFQEFKTWDEQLAFFKNKNFLQHYQLLNLKYMLSIVEYMKMLLNDQNLTKTEKKKYLSFLRTRLRESINNTEKENRSFDKIPVSYFLSNTITTGIYCIYRRLSGRSNNLDL